MTEEESAVSESPADVDLDEDEEIDHADEATGEDDQIDDPVRIYLMQMGEIPLLKPREELAAAKRIETSRRRFRQCMLANDYVLQAAVSLLECIRDNKVRLDRTIEVSVINIREKRRLLKVLAPICSLSIICSSKIAAISPWPSMTIIPEKNAAKHGAGCSSAG